VKALTMVEIHTKEVNEVVGEKHQQRRWFKRKKEYHIDKNNEQRKIKLVRNTNFGKHS
jgi:hypothetical protein